MTAMHRRSATGPGRWSTSAAEAILPDTDLGVPRMDAFTASTLTRGHPDEVARARGDRDLLLDSARTLVASTCHVRDPDAAGVSGVPTPCPGGDRCDLAHRLADVEHGPASELSVEAASRAFDSALAGALDAVRRCRQMQHGAGSCWFSGAPDVDGCAEVLQAAHRLG